MCEWQLVDAERFRKLLRSDEDTESWRVYPIGFDSQDNTYWLFDDNRLWIQYPPPPAPSKPKRPKKGLKPAPTEATATRKAAHSASARSDGAGNAAARSSKRTANSSVAESPAKRRARGSLQAVETNQCPRRIGSRSSRRLRGNDDEADDGWEPIPPELLVTQEADASHGTAEKKDIDEESELSEPPSAKAESGSDDHLVGSLADTQNMELGDGDSKSLLTRQTELKAKDVDPYEESWVEYETIAVTRSEWEAIQNRFAKSKHADEKALHAILRDDVCPRVLADIAEAEKQAALQAAMAMRKRSSRIAIKEAEREEERKQSEARAAMEERIRRVRAEEQDRQRKEDEARAEERRREERLREREERAKQREREAERKAIADIEGRERREKMREMRKRKRELIAGREALPADIAAATPGGGGDEDGEGDEEWDLRCEICLKSGRNLELDADEQIVCCESCLVWQHTKCWDSFDSWQGHTPRNWAKEDFFCTDCRTQRALTNGVGPLEARTKQHAYRQAQRNASVGSQIKKITLKRAPSAGPDTPTPPDVMSASRPITSLPPTHNQSFQPASQSSVSATTVPAVFGEATPSFGVLRRVHADTLSSVLSSQPAPLQTTQAQVDAKSCCSLFSEQQSLACRGSPFHSLEQRPADAQTIMSHVSSPHPLQQTFGSTSRPPQLTNNQQASVNGCPAPPQAQ